MLISFLLGVGCSSVGVCLAFSRDYIEVMCYQDGFIAGGASSGHHMGIRDVDMF